MSHIAKPRCTNKYTIAAPSIAKTTTVAQCRKKAVKDGLCRECASAKKGGK
jgi:predicted transcriptional regulator